MVKLVLSSFLVSLAIVFTMSPHSGESDLDTTIWLIPWSWSVLTRLRTGNQVIPLGLHNLLMSEKVGGTNRKMREKFPHRTFVSMPARQRKIFLHLIIDHKYEAAKIRLLSPP